MAFRDALEERTRERVPVDWAMTQNNLDTLHRRLESGRAALRAPEEAVAAYYAVLAVFHPGSRRAFLPVRRLNPSYHNIQGTKLRLSFPSHRRGRPC